MLFPSDRSRAGLPRIGLLAALACQAPSALSAQGSPFESPGLSQYGRLGQTTRFSTEFNPALGVALDGTFDYLDDDRQDGFDVQLRLFELNAAAYVDPKAWAYVVLTSENGETPAVEEAALAYTGFEGNTSLKVGRFFVDFGKQMQTHREELRTLERPLVLREFLGEELAGTGAQLGHWWPVGEASVARASIAAFGSLLPADEEERDGEGGGVAPERKALDGLSLAARLTGMTDVGADGQIQLGLSGRAVPEFAFRLGDLQESGLSNTVYGLDLTYGRSDETGLKRLLLGGEGLLFRGDLAAAVDDPNAPTALTVVDDTVSGLLLYADYGWAPRDSAGVQFSWIESPADPNASASELDVYYTRHLTEFRRLRVGAVVGDSDVSGDELRVYVQLTAFFGSHAHSLDW